MASSVSDENAARFLVSGEPADPTASRVFAQIRASGAEPVTMHRVLACAPDILAATYELAIALRRKTTISRAVAELLILRTAQIEGGDYEFAAHRHFALQTGISAEQIGALDDWAESGLFDAEQRAVLAYADALAARRHVPEDVYRGLTEHFPDQQIVELTMTAGFYIAAARLSAGADMRIEH